MSSDAILDAPTLTSNARDGFATSVALLDPSKLVDEDRDAIASALARGRARVAALATDTAAVDVVAREVALDGWRHRALRWTLAHGPADPASLFSMTELLHLGSQAPRPAFDAWGMSGLESLGCLCTRLATPGQWLLWTGRAQLGLTAQTVADLNLRVAEVLHELQLPAPLAKPVLEVAMQDFIDTVRPTNANDWLTLSRAAQAVGRERIEDYVAAVAADGPLVLDRRVVGD